MQAGTLAPPSKPQNFLPSCRLIKPDYTYGNSRWGKFHGSSTRLRALFCDPSLHEQGDPRHYFLVQLRNAANRRIVFTNDSRILVWIEIEGIRDVYCIGKKDFAALHINQTVSHADVELAQGAQTLRLNAQIAQTNQRRDS